MCFLVFVVSQGGSEGLIQMLLLGIRDLDKDITFSVIFCAKVSISCLFNVFQSVCAIGLIEVTWTYIR